MSGGVANVSVSNVTIWDSAEGLRLKAGAGRGGYIHDIFMTDSTITSTKVSRDNADFDCRVYSFDIDCCQNSFCDVIVRAQAPFMYNCNYGGHPAGYNKSAIPDVAGIHVSNTTGSRCALAADLEGLEVRSMASLEAVPVSTDVLLSVSNLFVREV